MVTDTDMRLARMIIRHASRDELERLWDAIAERSAELRREALAANPEEPPSPPSLKAPRSKPKRG
jgi:hypothetical protein